VKIFRSKTISYKSSAAVGAGTERSCLAYACFSLLLGLHTGNVIAGPEGGQVTAGQATISTPTATSTVIDQATQNVAIDWQSYNVKQNELVQYLQPNAAASALNKIFDQNPSQIFGTIKANGQVILVNPNGVFFSPTARVSVGSLIASGIDIKTDDFMQGKLNFDAAGAGGDGVVVNQGLIEAATGGSVNLIGKAVSNEGLILAHAGQVNLVAGEKMTMDFDGDGLIQFVVDREVLENAHGLDSQVNNSGTIEANGGSVLLSGNASKEVFSKVVNNSGVIKAGRIDKSGGRIRLVGSGSGNSLINTGTISASATTAGEDGGTVEISAENITSSGTIEAKAVDGNGGQINIESEDTTLLTEQSVVSVASELQQGGVAKILGDKAGLLDDTVVDASGATGGGEVLVGGDFQGANDEVKNATRTLVAGDAEIKADAIDEGDGGKVIVWSDEVTGFYGEISARGGEQDGDGGFVEVSGKEKLAFDGRVDTTADNGKTGTLLLDPRDILIDGNTTDDGDLPDILFADDNGGGATNDDFAISAGAINTSSNSNNIILQANRDIIQSAGEVITFTSGNSLVMQAGGNITLNDDVTTNGGDIHLESNSPSATDGNTGAGILTIATTKTVTSSGGNIILIAEDFTLDGSVAAGAGNISLTAISDSSGPTGEAAFEIGSAADLTDAELGRFSSTGTVTIGEATTASAAGVIGGGTMIRVGSIDFQAASNVSTAGGVAGSLVFTADNGITFNDDAAFGQAVTFNADGDGNNTGAITRGAAEVITASTVNLNAATGIAIDIVAANISAVNTTSGNIDLDNAATASTTLTNIDHQGTGNILFDQTGNQTLALTSVTANDGDITITNTGGADSDITVKTVTADTTDDTVSITAEDGIIDDAADTATDIISAANISLTSSANATGIGQGAEGAIQVNAVVSFAADASTGGGNITVEDTTGDFPLGLVDAGTGTVDLTSAGSMTDANAGANNIAAATADLTATGAIGDLAGAGNGDVSLAPTDSLETTVSTLSVDAVEAAIANTIAGGVTVSSVTPAGVAGSALITNNTDLAVTAHTLSNDGDSIGYVSTTGSVTVPDAAIDVGTGTIRIEAATDGQDVLDATDTDLSNNLWTADTVVFASGTGESLNLSVDNLTANITDTTGGGAGDLTVAEANGISLTDIDTADGKITVTATLGNIVVVDVDAAGTNIVALDSTAGNINDSGAVSEVITADSLRLSAETGILALDTAVSNLAAETDTTGNLEIFNTGALDITTVDGVVGVQIIDTGANDGGGDIVITASSPLTITDDVVNNDGGDITLAADGNAAGDDMAINANITATGGDGNINLFAGDAINLNGTNVVSAAGAGNITAIAGEDFVSGGANNNGTATGILTMGDGSSIETEDGNIVVRATGSVDLSVLDTDSDTAGAVGDVTVEADYAGIDGGLSTADTGDIQDILSGEGANIIGDTINLIGPDGIGAGEDINVTVITELNADSSGNNGNIELESTGAMPVGVINAGTGNVTLISGAAITDTNAGTLNITGTNLAMTASGAIGTSGDKIDTNVAQIVADTTAVDGSGVFINELDGAADGLAIGAGDILTDGGDVEIMSAGDVTSAGGSDIETSGEVNTAQASGSVTISTSGTAVINLAGNITTTGADHNAANGNTGGDVMLTTNDGTIDVALITTSGGDATTSGDNGGNAGLISLNTGSGNTINLDGATITANGGATVDATAGNGNDITFADPVMLNTGVTVSATGNTGGNIDFSNSVDGSQALAVNTNGTTTFGGAVGNATPLASVTTDAGGATRIDGGEVSTTGIQTYNDAVILGATANINTTGNNVIFNDTVNGSTANTEDLTIAAGTGDVSFNGTVGTGTPLGDVNVTSTGIFTIDSNTAPGANAAATTDTFLADSLRVRASNRINIGGDGDGDVILNGSGGGNVLDLQSTLALAGSVMEFSSSILLTAGDVLLETTANNSDIVMDVEGLTGAAGTPDERIIQTPGNITTLVGGGNAQTILQDFESGGNPAVSTDGKNTVLDGASVSVENLVTGTNLDDSVFPQILANTISVSFDGNLALGDDATSTLAFAHELDDAQMDGLLSGGATALGITVNALGADNGDIVLDRTTSFGANDLSLTAAGFITDNTNGLAFQSSGLLTLQSGADIGVTDPGGNTGNSFTIDVNNLITVADAVGAVNITNNASAGDATYAVDVAGTGSITNFTLTQDTNDLLINEINASGAVSINSAVAIVDNDDTDIDITGSTIHLVAATGIADGDELSINATDGTNGLAATTATGDINILDTAGGLSIGSLTTDFDDTGATTTTTNGVSITGGAAGDDIRIRANSPLTVNDAVSNTGGGDITLAAEGTALTDDLTIDDNITATGGNGTIQLFAGGDVVQNTGTTVSAAGATGTIDVFAGRDFNDGSPAAGHADGGIDMNGTASIQQADGATVSLTARGDVDVVTVSSTAGTVNVTAGDETFAADTAGAITDDNAATTNITATTTVLTADTGIDTDTAVDNLTADNITGNNIDITDADDVTLLTTFRNQAANGTMALTTTDGSIDTSTVAVSTQDGAITFTANDAGANNDRGITVGSGGMDSNGAGSGNITLNAADGVALGGDVDAGADNVTIDADNDAAEAGNLDTDGAISRTAGTVTGNTLDLDAAQGIVATLAGSTISADNNTTGDIDLDNTAPGAVTVTSLTAQGTGFVQFDQIGDESLQVNTATTNDGNVTLTNTGNAAADSLTVTTVTAGGTNDIQITTNTRGDVVVNGDLTATTNTITVDSSDDITLGNAIAISTGAGGQVNLNVDTNDDVAATLDLGTGSTITSADINFDGSAADFNDTIAAQDLANTWIITGSGTLDNANLSTTADWTDFQTIVGGNTTDTIDQTGGTAPDNAIDVVLTDVGAVDGMMGNISGTGITTTNFDNIDEIFTDETGSTLTGAPAAEIANATWTINGGNENYSDNGSGQDLDFSGSGIFTTLTGGTGNDKFDIDANYTGSIGGGAGNDEFEFADAVTLTGTIDGGAGTDILDVQLVTAAAVTVAGAGNTDGSRGDITATVDPINKGVAADDFDNIDTVEGAVGAFLTGPNVDTIWNITGNGSGTYGENGDETSFSNFTITGGDQADTFIFGGAGRLATVDGGSLGEGNTLIPFTPAGFGMEYTITGDGQGEDNSTLQILTGGGNEFFNIDILFGNDNADIFTVNDGVTWSGTFVAAANTGTATAAADQIIFNSTSSVTWQFNGAGTRPEVYDSNDISGSGTVVVGDIDAGDAAVDGTSGTATGSGFNFMEFEIVDGSDSGDIFNVQAIDNDLMVNTGTGTDVINVSSNAPTNTGSLDDILATLTLRDTGGTDTLNVSDGGDADADANGGLSDTEITGIFGSGGATHKIDYNDGGASEIENINIDLGSGGDAFGISGVAASSTVVLNANGGDDTVNIGGTANSLDGILGTLTVNGGAPSGAVGDTLIVNDAGDTTGTIYSISSGTINRAGIIPIDYTTFEQLDLLTGSGNDAITANGWAPVTGNVTDAGPADTDTFTVNTAFSVTGDFTINRIETLDNFPVPSMKALGADTLTIIEADTVGSAADPFDFSANTLVMTDSGGTGGTFVDNQGGNLDIDIDNIFGSDFSLDNGGNNLFITGTNGLDVATGNVELINVANVTQDATVTVGNLYVNSTGSVTLTDMANVINGLAADTTGGDVDIVYQNTNVGAFATPRGTAASGIDTNGGDLTLAAKSVTNSTRITADTETNGGDVNIDGGVDVDNATLDAGTGDLTLSTVDNNEFVQTSNTGLIVGDALAVNSRQTDVDTGINSFSGVSDTSFIRVDNTGGGTLTVNSVDTSAGNALIAISNDAGNIVVADDVNAGTGNVQLTTTTSGNINNGGGSVAGDMILLNAAGGIGITGGAVRTDVSGTTSNAREFRTGGAGSAGNINVNDVNSFNVSTLFFSTAGTAQTATIASNGGAGTITIDEAVSGDDGLGANDTLILDANINVTTTTVTTAGGLANLIYDGNTTLAGGNTTFTVDNLRFGGTVNTGGSDLEVGGTGNLGLNGDIQNAGIIDLDGINVVVEADSILESNVNDIRFAAGGISGSAPLQLIPSAVGESIAISTGTPSDLNFNPAVFSAFSGHLIIGGTLDPATLPIEPTAATVLADLITIEDPFNMPSAQGLTLLASGIVLDTNSISVGGAGGGAFNAIAVGNACTVCAGLTQDGNITANQNIVIDAGSGVLVSEGTIENAGNIELNFAGGNVQVALGENEDNANNLQGNATGSELDAGIENFINNVLGLTVNAVVVSFFNPASALIGLQEVAFIDVGLFEEELTLFGTIGRGIALSLAQCEEIEGCAPNVTEEELVELIEGLEGRIEELERRLVEESDPVERARLEELITGFTQELENFRDYQQQLAEFFEPAEEEFEDEFADEFTDEFVEEAPAGPPDVDTVEKLAGMLKVVNARIQWLESLKDDPEERARLSEITGMELTKEDLDAIIEATRAEAGFIENQLKLLLEGKEARNDDLQPLFTADAGDDANIMTVAYGPSPLDLATQGTTLYYR